MRLHVVSLPHTQLTKEYSCCAYTEKVRKFQRMMQAEGHEVFTYGSEDGDDVICCISKQQQAALGFSGPQDYLKIDFNAPEPWGTFNFAVIAEIGKRIQPGDIICVITSTPAEEIKRAFPDNITVEFGVGYKGVMHPSFRVFESYAWRNFVYGKFDLDGQFYDEVIPNYFEVDDFPMAEQPDDYFLFIGRINANKGLNIAQDVCERLGAKLIVAGPGEFSGYGEYVGPVGPKLRGTLMSHAKAVFVPTMYVPPFEGVHIEANLCGTPVITTDFGVFSETVVNGLNGYRCRNLHEFMEAAQNVWMCNRQQIRSRAQSIYSLEVIGPRYTEYFERLSDLYKGGFYQLPEHV